MKVLVACEESQAVTIELRKRGHEAYSCDIIECSGGHPEWHIRQDVLTILNPVSILSQSDPQWRGIGFHTEDEEWHYIENKWDMIIAFPPCTHLALSGAKHFEKKRADGRQREGIEFFCQFLTADCDRIAIENPAGIMSGGKYIVTHFPDFAEKYNIPVPETQRVHPWMFGDPYEKTTCLWLKGLPMLAPTNPVEPEPRHITSGGNSLPSWYSNSSIRMKGNRQTVRSKTFPGIAKAMAEQWGACL
jgi:hypothetical protein